MKPNKLAIQQMVYNKFLEKAFETVVSSTFISAIPMSNEEKGSAVKELRKYSNAAVEAAGGYDLLVDAIHTETDPHKLSFLKDLNDICVATATEASKRFALEASEDDFDAEGAGDIEDMEGTEDVEDTDLNDDVDALGSIDGSEDDVAEDPAEPETPEEPKKKVLVGKSLQELALDARMTDAEYKSLAKRAESIDVPEISKIISDKIVKTVNAEKQAYQDMDEASERLKDALIEKDDNEITTHEEAKEAVDRIIDINFSKSCPREHKSIFSKLQLNAAEMLMATENVDFSKIDSKTLTKITCRTAPMIFKEKTTLSSALEEVMATRLNPDSADDYEYLKKAKFGSVLAIIIITLLETLNTLSLHKMHRKEAIAITNGPDISASNPATISNGLNAQTAVALEKLTKTIRQTRDAAVVESALNTLNGLSAKLNECSNAGYNIQKGITSAIESLKAEAGIRYNRLTRDFETVTEGIALTTAAKNDMGNRSDKIFMANVAKNISKRHPEKVVFKIASEGAVHVDFLKGVSNVYTMSAAFESAHGGLSNTEYFKALAREASIPNIEYDDGTEPTMVILDNTGRHTF